MLFTHVNSRGQDSLEYLMLIAGAVLVAVVILLLLSSGIIPTGGNILTNNLNLYNNQFGNGGNFSPGDGLCSGGVSNGIYEPQAGEECDGTQLPPGADCASMGFGTGPLTCTSQCSFDTSACIPAGEPVTIIRDTWGVAHVFSATDAGAFFGWGYAAAQDRWFIMDYTRMQMRGRLSELVGSSAYYDDYTKRMFGYAALEERRYLNLSPSSRAALDAYAAGVNYYLTTQTAELAAHPMSAHPYFQSRVFEPWRPADSLLVWDSVFLQGPDESEVAQLRVLENLPPGSTPAEICTAMNFTYFIDNEAAVVKQSDMPTANAAMSYAAGHPTYCNGLSYYYPPPKASHAWAVSGSRSTTGNTIIHGDPQILIETPSLFHEVHVSGATFNARGVNAPGSVGFFVGFNSRAAWSGTKLASDTDDVFRLEMVSPTTYRDASGTIHSFVPRNEIILSSTGAPTNVQFFETIYGPVITDYFDATDAQGDQFVWRSSLFYDMSHHTLDATLAMLRAQSVNDIASAMQYWHTPSANIVFGDASGNIGYWYGARPPMRDADSPVPGYIAQETDNDWIELIPHNLLPHTINPASGVVFSANHLPVGDWYPIYLSWIGGGGDTIRSYRLRQLLGLQSGDAPVYPGDAGYLDQYSPQDVLNIHEDSVHSVKTMGVKAALYAKDNLSHTFSPNAENALTFLRTWYLNGAKSHSDELYWPLAESISMSQFFKDPNNNVVQLYRPDDSGIVAWLKNVDHNITNDLGLSPNEITILDQALSNAWTVANNTYGNNPAQWNSVYATRPGDGRFRFHYYDPISPANDTSAIGGGTYNVTFDNIPYPNLDTLGAMRGQSYSQFVDFSNVDNAQAVSPITVTDNPNSPYWLAQSNEFASHDLRPAPLTRARVDTIMDSQSIIYMP